MEGQLGVGVIFVDRVKILIVLAAPSYLVPFVLCDGIEIPNRYVRADSMIGQCQCTPICADYDIRLITHGEQGGIEHAAGANYDMPRAGTGGLCT